MTWWTAMRSIPGRLEHIERMLKRLEPKVEKIMIDTSKALAAVALERTESASLRALVAQQTAAVKDLSAQLTAAIAANDPVALAQVQTDLDKIAADLSTDNTATQAAIDANTPAATPTP